MSGTTAQEDTMLDRFNSNDAFARAMMSLSEVEGMGLVETRREEVFSVMWEETGMEREEVLSNVQEREEDFIEYCSEVEGVDDIPSWMLRLESQDLVMKAFIEKMNQ